jgi:transglutaminase-like putative cysteine protease/pimeloyl-ACP methyl ester carboxylesterase
MRLIVFLVFALAVVAPQPGICSPAEKSSAAAIRELHRWLALPRAERPPLTNTPFAQTPLKKPDAGAALQMLWQDRVAFIRKTRAAEMAAKEIELDGEKMKFAWLTFGDTNSVPTNGRSLFISMHGGGNAPAEVNDSQWTNQIRLGKSYRPAEGIYLAPRAPTDTWDLWHQAPIDDFFARLIEDFVVFENVNPNRVFLMGYSAGGDGVYQLAPRTPDRWAAAAMMAGHPNDASPLGLRNVPFAIQVGAEDAAYHRNEVAAEWGKKLDALELADPAGYAHFTELHAGKGHWMDLEDREAVPWMEKFSRAPLPEKIVWFQNGVTHPRCYWLARPPDEVQAGQVLVAERAGQVITLASTNAETVTVLLNDAMMDLSQPVVIRGGGQILFSNRVSRNVATLAESLAARGDTNLAFSASVTVKLPPPPDERWWSEGAELALEDSGTNGPQLTVALQTVPAAQREAMQFLIANLPAPDRQKLSAKFLLDDVAQAQKFFSAAPWAGQIPPEIFRNDILPYAVVNETRDDWRGKLHDLCAPLVAGCRTPGDAALALNQKLFGLVKVHYSTKRKKADQSALETMDSGLATCTGLSILLVDACRAVGVPARIAGTPMWMNLRGNHTWVEIWDGDWHFLGAAEPDAAGLDHAWFVHDASEARKDEPAHAIYASSFKATGVIFPLDWAPDIHWVNAVNVTDRYTKKIPPTAGTVRLLVKVLNANGRRVAAPVTAADPADAAKTFYGNSCDESADLNHILPFDWPAGARCVIRVEANGRTQAETVVAPTNGEQVVTIQLKN